MIGNKDQTRGNKEPQVWPHLGPTHQLVSVGRFQGLIPNTQTKYTVYLYICQRQTHKYISFQRKILYRRRFQRKFTTSKHIGSCILKVRLNVITKMFPFTFIPSLHSLHIYLFLILVIVCKAGIAIQGRDKKIKGIFMTLLFILQTQMLQINSRSFRY